MNKTFSKLCASILVALLLSAGAWIISGPIISWVDNTLYSGAYQNIEHIFNGFLSVIAGLIGFGMRWNSKE